MQCPKCKGKGWCYATKYYDFLRVRYRRCPDCGHKFRTEEEIRDHTPLREYAHVQQYEAVPAKESQTEE